MEAEKRIKHFNEFHETICLEEQKKATSRCMTCGVPFCQFGGMISGMMSGCPLHNLMPEINDLVKDGNLEQAYYRLSKTHSFPEFTSRVCPALCEAACTRGGINETPVPSKASEKAIIDYAFEAGLVKEEAPAFRTGKKIAVIGSGPAGLAAAQLLNRRGHLVTVFERSDRVGGLLRYGIPNMKLDKHMIDRRVALLEAAGVIFKTNCNVGKDISAEEIQASFDAVVLACGASKPRDIQVPGREGKNILFAVEYLSEVTKKLLDEDYDSQAVIDAKDFSFGDLTGKDVVVIGGGDTGNDCVGTSIRLKCGSVTQLEMMPAAPIARSTSNPWPEWPRVLKTDYGQEEAIYCFRKDPRIFETTVKEFLVGENGQVSGVKTVKLSRQMDPESGKMVMKEVEGSEATLKADLVLIAAGFLGAESYVTDAFKVDVTERSQVKSEKAGFASSVPGVFSAGDMHIGQSLVVRAIDEGRRVAKEVDTYLMGYSNL